MPRTEPILEPRTAIVIPAYNHASAVRRVAEAALRIHKPVIVVDDGSTDETAESLHGLKLNIVRHERNNGKGAAILTGAREASRLGMTHIVTIDADGQHDPADFLRFLPLIGANPDAIIVGCRSFDRRAPRLSKFGRTFSNFWLRVQTGIRVGDAQSGYRAYPLAVLNQLKLRETGYAFEIEVLVKAAWAGVSLIDIVVSVYYPPPGDRVSHFSLYRDNLRLARLNTLLTVRALLPLPRRRISGTGTAISIFHPVRSLKILLMENLLPSRLAAAAGLGVFLGALPLIACHTLIILATAAFFRLNKVTAVSASQICMPPLVPAICIETGYLLRHGSLLTDVSLQTLGYQGLERIFEWLIGSLIIGPVLAIATGGVIYITAHGLKWSIDARHK